MLLHPVLGCCLRYLELGLCVLLGCRDLLGASVTECALGFVMKLIVPYVVTCAARIVVVVFGSQVVLGRVHRRSLLSPAVRLQISLLELCPMLCRSAVVMVVRVCGP